MTRDTIIVIVAWVLLLAPLLPISVAVLLAPDALSRNIPLRERVGIAIRDAIAASIIGILAANVLFEWQLSDSLRFTLLVIGYLSISVPSGIWLYLFWRGRYG